MKKKKKRKKYNVKFGYISYIYYIPLHFNIGILEIKGKRIQKDK